MTTVTLRSPNALDVSAVSSAAMPGLRIAFAAWLDALQALAASPASPDRQQGERDRLCAVEAFGATLMPHIAAIAAAIRRGDLAPKSASFLN